MRPKSRGRSVWSARSLEGAGLLARGWGGWVGWLRRAPGECAYFCSAFFKREEGSYFRSNSLVSKFMFITNNHASLHLLWKENLVWNQKVFKYYVHYCRIVEYLQLGDWTTNENPLTFPIFPRKFKNRLNTSLIYNLIWIKFKYFKRT